MPVVIYRTYLRIMIPGILLMICSILPFPEQVQETEGTDYPMKPEAVADKFVICYENGDLATANYVLFAGKHVQDMGGTPQELEKELLPEELNKNRKNPAKADAVTLVFSQNDKTYGEDTYYVTYMSRGKKHKFTMFLIEGKWKVDISYLWMGDWYDWMPGY